MWSWQRWHRLSLCIWSHPAHANLKPSVRSEPRYRAATEVQASLLTSNSPQAVHWHSVCTHQTELLLHQPPHFLAATEVHVLTLSLHSVCVWTPHPVCVWTRHTVCVWTRHTVCVWTRHTVCVWTRHSVCVGLDTQSVFGLDTQSVFGLGTQSMLGLDTQSVFGLDTQSAHSVQSHFCATSPTSSSLLSVCIDPSKTLCSCWSNWSTEHTHLVLSHQCAGSPTSLPPGSPQWCPECVGTWECECKSGGVYLKDQEWTKGNYANVKVKTQIWGCYRKFLKERQSEFGAIVFGFWGDFWGGIQALKSGFKSR